MKSDDEYKELYGAQWFEHKEADNRIAELEAELAEAKKELRKGFDGEFQRLRELAEEEVGKNRKLEAENKALRTANCGNCKWLDDEICLDASPCNHPDEPCSKGCRENWQALVRSNDTNVRSGIDISEKRVDEPEVSDNITSSGRAMQVIRTQTTGKDTDENA